MVYVSAPRRRWEPADGKRRRGLQAVLSPNQSPASAGLIREGGAREPAQFQARGKARRRKRSPADFAPTFWLIAVPGPALKPGLGGEPAEKPDLLFSRFLAKKHPAFWRKGAAVRGGHLRPPAEMGTVRREATLRRRSALAALAHCRSRPGIETGPPTASLRRNLTCFIRPRRRRSALAALAHCRSRPGIETGPPTASLRRNLTCFIRPRRRRSAFPPTRCAAREAEAAVGHRQAQLPAVGASAELLCEYALRHIAEHRG